MKLLHCGVRYLFEQEIMPQLLSENTYELAELIKTKPDEFLAAIDNNAWTKALNTGLIRFLSEDEEEYTLNTTEELYKLLDSKTDEYKVHAYQSYNAEAIKLDENKYCILLHMADIDELLISSYVVVVYEENIGFSYFTLEQSLDDNYCLCSPKLEGRINYGIIDNNKESLLKAIIDILNNSSEEK